MGSDLLRLVLLDVDLPKNALEYLARPGRATWARIADGAQCQSVPQVGNIALNLYGYSGYFRFGWAVDSAELRIG